MSLDAEVETFILKNAKKQADMFESLYFRFSLIFQKA